MGDPLIEPDEHLAGLPATTAVWSSGPATLRMASRSSKTGKDPTRSPPQGPPPQPRSPASRNRPQRCQDLGAIVLLVAIGVVSTGPASPHPCDHNGLLGPDQASSRHPTWPTRMLDPYQRSTTSSTGPAGAPCPGARPLPRPRRLRPGGGSGGAGRGGVSPRGGQLQPLLLDRPHAGLLLPGRAVCPALGTRGTVDTVARPKAARASDEANEVGHGSRLPSRARLGCRVGWRRLRLGVGHASTLRPAPSTLGAGGERASHHEAGRPVPGRSR